LYARLIEHQATKDKGLISGSDYYQLVHHGSSLSINLALCLSLPVSHRPKKDKKVLP